MAMAKHTSLFLSLLGILLSQEISGFLQPSISSLSLSGRSAYGLANDAINRNGGSSSWNRRRRHTMNTHLSMAVTTADAPVETLRFLTPEVAEKVRNTVGTPAFVYDLKSLKENASKCLSFPNPYGLTVRFAMKACPNAAILQVFHSMGLFFDCSSGWEVKRARHAGIPANKLGLSTQELPEDFAQLMESGIHINACSINQLERIGKARPGATIGLRFNPGLGSGGTGKTNVGGPGSSFGIWHKLLPEVKELVERYNLNIDTIHTHIGSGSDPAVWQKVAGMSLALCKEFSSVKILNLGGGFKVGRVIGEKSTDLQIVGAPVAQQIKDFAQETGRELKLEIEPGTFLVANVGSLVSTVQDMTTTAVGGVPMGGSKGFDFLKLDSGMTDLLRPSLYGAQHPIVSVPKKPSGTINKYVVVGHCCESGDLFTPQPGAPDDIAERAIEAVEIGDLVVIEGCGAYTASMNSKNYNSFPETPEVMLDGSGVLHLIRRRQDIAQVYENEVQLPERLLG